MPRKSLVLDGPNTRPVLRPPLRWWGGKYYIANKIISLMPPHARYLETHAGAASVLLNKPYGEDYYNDLDNRLFRFFVVLRDHKDELIKTLQLTPWCEAEFAACAEPAPEGASLVELVRRDFVRWRMSRDGAEKSMCTPAKRSRRGIANNVAGFLSIIDEELPKIADRLRSVEILSRDALEAIEGLDGPDTLFYCDPPYPHAARVSKDIYNYEMTDADHVELAGVLHAIEGKAMISCYHCELYDDLYGDWHLAEIPKKKDVGSGPKSEVVECVWMNYKPRV